MPPAIWQTPRGAQEAPPWWSTDTRLYRLGHVAKAWGMDPVTFLQLPARARKYCELYLIAEGLKTEARQQAETAQQETAQGQQHFAQQAAQWEATIAAQYGPRAGHASPQ